MKGFRVQALLGILLTGAVVVTELWQPKLMAAIVDTGIPAGDMSYILREGIGMIILAFVGILCGVGGVVFASVAAAGFGRNIREASFGKIQEFSFTNIDRCSSASLVTRLTNDTNFLQNTALMCLRMLVRAPVMLAGALIMAYLTDASLSVVLFSSIPLLLLIIFVIVKLGFPRFIAMQKKTDKLNATVQENLTNVRVVKSFVREEYEKGKFGISNEDLTRAAVKASNIMILIVPSMLLVLNFATVIVMWVGGSQIVEGSGLQIGNLMVFINYMMHTLMSLMILSVTLMMFSRSKASADRIREILDTEIDITDCTDCDETVADGSVEFRDVSFFYGDSTKAPVLSHISFKAAAGETIGIIGSTGCGKSSLVNLIPRLYDVSGGEILVGGKDVRSYKLETLRGAVAAVPQKNVLFSGTIAENVRWGNENASDEEVIDACKNACAHEFISSFPDGYMTDISQGGVNVSGGQKQRLCIARAMLKKPLVLILDDSTSALDAATETAVKKSFRENLAGVTVFLVAQKVSSVCDADRILVLENGEIAGFDTHQNLLASNEIYQEIYRSQQREGVVYAG